MAKADGQSSNRKRFFGETCLPGVERGQWFQRLRSDKKPARTAFPSSLQEYRDREGKAAREKRLRDLWEQLPKQGPSLAEADSFARTTISVGDYASLTPERAM